MLRGEEIKFCPGTIQSPSCVETGRNFRLPLKPNFRADFCDLNPACLLESLEVSPVGKSHGKSQKSIYSVYIEKGTSPPYVLDKEYYASVPCIIFTNADRGNTAIRFSFFWSFNCTSLLKRFLRNNFKEM